MSIHKDVKPDDSAVLDLIRTGNPRVTEELYHAYRKAFIAWAISAYACKEEDAVEVYQKAFTILYFNIRNGKLSVLSSSLKTYLFSIAKNVFRERFREKQKDYDTLALEDLHQSPDFQNQVDNSILDQYKHDEQKELVRSLLSRIGEPCARLLKLIFIQGFASDAVAEEMNYSDERVVRKRKSLCLKQLREMMGIEKKQ